MTTQATNNTNSSPAKPMEWSETKAKIKAKWAKFSDVEIDGFKDHLDKVSAQIQKTYGIAKEQADKEYADFTAAIKAVAAPVVAPKAPAQSGAI